MAEEKIIKLPCYNIVVTLTKKEPDDMSSYWQGGSITSDAKEVCKHCEDPNCEMDCPEFGEHCTDRDSDMFNMKANERDGFVVFNRSVDIIESIILVHAKAGIDIETPAYIEGIETAFDALGNNT